MTRITKLNSPRVLRTGAPLTLEGIRQTCPAVFAEGPAPERSARYHYVPTIEPLTKLMDNGWGVYEASQQRATKNSERNGFTKHMLRMRKLSDFDVTAKIGHGVPEVILINAHDATSAYHLKSGWFEFICSNGMMVGKMIGGVTVRHTIGPQTSQEVLEAGERVVTESFPRMIERIEAYKRITLDVDKQYRLANRALDLRYPNVVLRPVTNAQLLTAQHHEQEEPTLWNILNRVQENTIGQGVPAPLNV
jgi:hypothetical protein